MSCGIKNGVSKEDVEELMVAKGYDGVKVFQRSSELWVLELNSKEVYSKFLKEDQDWLNLMFVFVRPWKEVDVSGRREVWLDVHGVPLHAWCPQFFKKIGNYFGKTLEIAHSTLSKGNLKVGKILVETPIFERISRQFTVKIWRNNFTI